MLLSLFLNSAGKLFSEESISIIIYAFVINRLSLFLNSVGK